MESIKSHLETYLQNESFQKRYQTLINEVVNHPDIQQLIEENKLSDAIVQESYPKFFEYITEKKRIEETGKSQNEGFEPRLSVMDNQVVITYEPTQEYLDAQAQRELYNRVQMFEIPKIMTGLTLESIELTTNRVDVFQHLKQFVADMKQGSKPKGLYLFGSFGIGKTHILGALAGTLAKEGFSSYIAHVPSLIVDLKTAIQDQRVGVKIEQLKHAQVLMLDDIGGESLTPWVRDDIFTVVLDYRMRENLPTFFTSNLSFDDLEEHFASTKVEDERKAKRLMERVKFLATPLELRGANRR